ncbi:MAG: NAD(P)-dependent oxidoreductase [bacterium]|nr:NAD(P)-dependent oxidoreductase [bacterium]MCP5065090.1 NAD(P)-dependent oxidoreductase [bacterium]
MKGEKILITGVTGQVAAPVARALASDNEVWAIARFKDPDVRTALEAANVHCETVDLMEGGLGHLPRDFSSVLHFAVAKTGNFDADLTANAEGTGFLMHHCRDARAFLHCSSTAVYQPNDHELLAETAPLGDNHRPFGFLPTYSICKIAAEATARFCARHFELPTVIARLNVPYGNDGSWPALHLELMRRDKPIQVHANPPSIFNPIHEDDVIAQIPRLLEVASVPATILNWGGSDVVSVEEWCGYLGELTGLTPRFDATTQTIESTAIDTTRMHELIGRTRVSWRDGFRRMVESRNPELLKKDSMSE